MKARCIVEDTVPKFGSLLKLSIIKHYCTNKFGLFKKDHTHKGLYLMIRPIRYETSFPAKLGIKKICRLVEFGIRKVGIAFEFGMLKFSKRIEFGFVEFGLSVEFSAYELRTMTTEFGLIKERVLFEYCTRENNISFELSLIEIGIATIESSV